MSNVMNTTTLSNDKKFCEIKQENLPLYCPPSGNSLWNSHPRVYLPIENSPTGKVKCPYCGTDYQLFQR